MHPLPGPRKHESYKKKPNAFVQAPSDNELFEGDVFDAKREALKRELDLAKRSALHPLPEIPAPPELAELGPRAYVRKRLEDLTPYLLEARIYRLRYGEDHERAKVEEELLDRAGFTRKPDGLEAGNRQVIVVNNIVNPYAQAPESPTALTVEAAVAPALPSSTPPPDDDPAP